MMRVPLFALLILGLGACEPSMVWTVSATGPADRYVGELSGVLIRVSHDGDGDHHVISAEPEQSEIATLMPLRVQAGREEHLVVQFVASEAGTYTDSVLLEFSDGQARRVSFSGKACAQELAVHGFTDAGDVPVGCSARLALSVGPADTCMLQLRSLELLDSDENVLFAAKAPIVIVPGSGYGFSVEHDVTREGPLGLRVVVQMGEWDDPVTIELTGQGVPPGECP